MFHPSSTTGDISVVAVGVVIVAGALMGRHMSDHCLRQLPGVGTCQRGWAHSIKSMDVNLYKALKMYIILPTKPGQPRCSWAQHQLFLPDDHPDILRSNSAHEIQSGNRLQTCYSSRQLLFFRQSSSCCSQHCSHRRAGLARAWSCRAPG